MRFVIFKEYFKDGNLVSRSPLLNTKDRKVAVHRLHWLFMQQVRRWKHEPHENGFDPKTYSFWWINTRRNETIAVTLETANDYGKTKR